MICYYFNIISVCLWKINSLSLSLSLQSFLPFISSFHSGLQLSEAIRERVTRNSFTSDLCKVGLIEGFIKNRTLKHFTDNNLFNNNQYDFLRTINNVATLLYNG